jgi:hypothetical protein
MGCYQEETVRGSCNLFPPRLVLFSLVFLLFLNVHPADTRAHPLSPPTELNAQDTPNDHGKSISLHWELSADDGKPAAELLSYEILRRTERGGVFRVVGGVPAGTRGFTDQDTALVNSHDYYYQVRAIGPAGSATSEITGPVTPSGQWFHTGKISVFVATLLFSLIIIVTIRYAKRGGKLYIRPLAGINAVDEAIGRATEMGQPILFVPGLGEAYEVATIAAFTVLGRVARKTAEYQSRLIVPAYYPMVMVVSQEVVKSAYMDAGRPDIYNEKDIFFVTQEQFPYAAAVNGIMLRERPAANFYLGKFYAESLMLAETGFLAGSIQIAGTDEPIQIPFFVAACDYVLIGEELYAASAYLSQEPVQLGTLKGQDWNKLVIMILVGLGILAATLGFTWVVNLFNVNI